jgi:hypothetical protein
MWGRERTLKRARSRRSGSLALPAALIVSLALLALPGHLPPSPAAAQDGPSIGIDTAPAGNDRTSLGEIQPCVSVQEGDTFSVDIFIRDVEELLAWQVYLEFDPEVVEVTGRDVEMFLAGNPGSSVLDASGRSGQPQLYEVSAADTSDPPTPDSGSGVLARLELSALGEGATDLTLISRDIDGDGADDIGPLLKNVDAETIGDTDDDTIFDGPVENAQVVVGGPCDNAPPPDSNPETVEEDSGMHVATIVIAVVAAAAVLAVSGLVAFRLLRRRGPPAG